MKKIIFITLVAAIVPALFFVMVGCMKKPEHKADFGPEVDAKLIQKALNELGSPDAKTIKKDEFAYSETSLAIDTSPAEVALQTGKTVLNSTTSGNRVIVTLVLEERDLLSSSKPESDIKQLPPLCYPLVEGACGSSTAAIDSEAPKNSAELLAKVKSLSADSDPDTVQVAASARVTYHNLVKSKVNWPVPKAAKQRPDCGGLKDCKEVPASKITFDMVTWENENRGHKKSYTIVSSPALMPFYSADVLFCIQDWREIQNRVVAITQCEEVKDFTFGKATSTEVAKKHKAPIPHALLAKKPESILSTLLSEKKKDSKIEKISNSKDLKELLIFR